mgnify:CR=1 FL=1
MFKEGLTKKALSLGTALTLSVACVLTSFSTTPAKTKAATIPGMSYLSDQTENDDNTTDVDDNTNNGDDTTDVTTGSAIKVTTNFNKLGIVTKKSGFVNVNRGAGTNTKVVGRLYKGYKVNIIGSTNKSWLKIKSGRVSGYVAKKYFAVGQAAAKVADKYGTEYVKVTKSAKKVSLKASKNSDAKTLTSIKTGKSYKLVKLYNDGWAKIKSGKKTGYTDELSSMTAYYSFSNALTLNGVRARRYGSIKGYQASVYAQKFVGNRYVWGGTSLTHGTDCSGFTMSVYRKFGYRIPRTSREQSTYGKKVSFSNLAPGDLIFYTHGTGRVNHVAMYIGNGKIVHASNPRTGIKISRYNYSRPKCARRIAYK